MISLILLAGIIADWNGTWAGNWKHGDGIQIIMAGNVATGIFLHGDYLPDDLRASVSPDGKTLTIRWGGSSAVLKRDTATTAHIAIHESGHADAAFAVTRDP
jgi:hypothetical protein